MAFGAVFELSSLNGTNGYTLTGVSAGDFAGFSVSGAGDVNNDGIDDLIIGAYLADPSGGSDAGETYVVFGTAANTGATVDLSALDGSDGFRLDGGGSGDRSGYSVSDAGDVNGDGFDDIIIGAYRADPGSQTDAGDSYVVFGSGSGFSASLDLDALNGSDGFALSGVDAGDEAGWSVASAGDVNGDGFDDVIVGAPGADNDAGESFVVFGRSTAFPARIDLGSLNGNNGFRIDGIDTDDRSGLSVSGAGDINGDGFDDVIVGAHRADPGGNSAAGESYVVFGRGTGFSSSLALSGLNGSNGFRLDGIDVADESGWAVSGAGDINDDGFDDLVIGAYLADPAGNVSGETYVVFGSSSVSSSFDLNSLDGSNGFVLNGGSTGDRSGFSVSRAGDVNGDGIADLIVGAINADPDGRNNAGESYVVYGRAGGFSAEINLSALDGTDGFAIRGIDGDDESGYSVSAAGDVNGDGVDDLIVGARGADPNARSNAGEAYVIFGDDGTEFGTEGPDLLEGGTGPDELFGLGGRDTLRGFGGDDTLNGGAGPDILNGFSGSDTASYAGVLPGVNVALWNGRAQGGEAQGDTLFSIENLIGTQSDDTLEGDAGANRLLGRFGNDVIIGGRGNDVLGGDGSDDLLEGGEGADQLFGSNGSDTASYRSSSAAVTVKLFNGTATGGDAEGDALVSIENLTGSNRDDVLSGDAGANTLRGGEGDDLIDGGRGNDALGGEGGDDTLEGGDGADRLFGGPGSDWARYETSDGGVTVALFNNTGTGAHAEGDRFFDIENLIGSFDADHLSGDAGANTIRGRADNDYLNGGRGNDSLFGENGDDTLEGGAGADRLVGGPGLDTAQYTSSSVGVTVALWNGTASGGDAAGDEFSSIENLNGSNRSDRLTGTNEDNTLRGRDDNDTLIGGAGDDALGGEFGNDRLIGQTGDDTLFGGPGSDSIVFDDGDDVDLVFGFEDDIDTLVLTRDLVGQRNASQVVADFAISFGGSTVLNFGGGDQIELRGFANRNDLVDDIDIV